MNPKRLRRIVATTVGVFGTAMLLLLALLVGNADRGLSASTSAIGWTVPILSGVLIGGVAWVLLLRGPNHFDDSPPPDTVPCASCGRIVMRDWKLCPYCGSNKEDAAGTGEPGRAPESS